MPNRTTVERMMREVHRNTPSTVTRANVKGKKKEAMLRAIAFAKARKAQRSHGLSDALGR